MVKREIPAGGRLVELTIGRAELVGTCDICEEPTTGSYDSDHPSFDLQCVNCGRKSHTITALPWVPIYIFPGSKNKEKD